MWNLDDLLFDSHGEYIHLIWYNFRTELRYNIVSKGIEKWARQPISPKGMEDNQRQEQM